MSHASPRLSTGALRLLIVSLIALAVVSSNHAAPDPVGDLLDGATGPDIVAFAAVHLENDLKLTLELAEPPRLADTGEADALVGFIDLDVDRQSATGELAFAEFLSGQPADMGDELYLDLSTYENGAVDLVSGGGGEVVDRVSMALNGKTLTVLVPHATLGTSSPVHLAAVVGDDAAPSDVAPNGGFVSSTGAMSGAPTLLDGRFTAEVSWRDFAGETGVGTLAVGSADSAVFWFFSADNWELLVKMVDGCSFNQRFWVFAAATTNVEYTLTVTDTVTGETAVYRNPLGVSAAAVTDTDAFATCS